MTSKRKYLFGTRWFGFFMGLCILSIFFVLVSRQKRSLFFSPKEKQQIVNGALISDEEIEKLPVQSLFVDLQNQITQTEIKELEKQFQISFIPVNIKENKEKLFRVRFIGHQSARALVQILEKLRRSSSVETADIDFMYSIPENGLDSLTKPEEEGLSIHPELSSSLLGSTPMKNSVQNKFVPNDPKYKYQWHLDQIHMPEAWASAQGEGVIVAVIDTGVAQVEDLQGTRFVPGWNFVQNNENASDDHGHGTHVAGTIAQTTHNGIGVAGVAYKAKIMPIKVLSAGGSGSISGIVAGIYFAVDHGAKVINMSLGGPYYSSALAKAVKHARKKGVVVICAAGNDGKGRVSYPAANEGAIAVAATQFDEKTTFYSNWGKEIAVAAPGGNTRLDQNGDGVPDGVMQNTVVPGNIEKQDYLLFMGTSMASPHVAGVSALLVGAGLSNPNEVEQVLRDTARKPTFYQGKQDPHYGAGIVDAAAALKAIHVVKNKTEFSFSHFSIMMVILVLVRLLVRKNFTNIGFKGALLWNVIGFSFQAFFYSKLGHLASFGFCSGVITLVISSAFPLLSLLLIFWQHQRIRQFISGFFLGQGVLLLIFGLTLADLSFGIRLWLELQSILCVGCWWFLTKIQRI